MDSSASSPAPPPTTASSPKPLTRTEPAKPYPTTFIQADTSSFKQVVQLLTGSPSAKPDAKPQSASPSVHSRLHSIPPIKPGIAKKPGSGSPGFKLYERRNSLKNLKINPLLPPLAFSVVETEIFSPSILDFPSLSLSPVTPLNHDPFTRSPTILGPYCHGHNNAGSPDEKSGDSVSPGRVDSGAEERGIREKGFFLHPSPRDTEPRLLPLFPVTSPRVSGD